MTSENRNENNKCHKRKIKARPLRQPLQLTASTGSEGFLHVHWGGKTKADSLTKSIANNILTEKSDKAGTSLKTAQRGHSNSKNDAGSWEQSHSFWCSFLSQGKQQIPKRKPALPSIPRGPLADPHANTPEGPESSFFPPQVQGQPWPRCPVELGGSQPPQPSSLGGHAKFSLQGARSHLDRDPLPAWVVAGHVSHHWPPASSRPAQPGA